MTEFQDKVVLITGAGRAIGRAVARAFAARGAIIAANDLTPLNLDETVALVKAGGGRIKDYVHDAAKKMPLQALITQVQEDWDRIDILINCAGVAPRADLFTIDEWDWLRTLDVNLNGPFFAMQSVARLMRETGGGVMVNIAPVESSYGGAGQAALAASRAGLIGLTREAARELAPYGIRINAVCPNGDISSRQGRDKPAPAGSSADLPGAHLVAPEDIAELVLFLCSDAARSITGQVISVDQV